MEQNPIPQANITTPNTVLDVMGKLGTITCINVAQAGEPEHLKWVGKAAHAPISWAARDTPEQAKQDVRDHAAGKVVAYEPVSVVPLKQDSRVEQIRQRLQAATPGPWHHDEARSYVSGKPFSDQGANIYTNVKYPHSAEYERVVEGGCQDEQGGAVGVLRTEDARFIAHAPEDIIYLLQLVTTAQQVAENAFQHAATLQEQLHQATREGEALRGHVKAALDTYDQEIFAISVGGPFSEINTVQAMTSLAKVANHLRQLPPPGPTPSSGACQKGGEGNG